MFIDFLREFVGEIPLYPSGTQINSAYYYGQLLEYGFACILAFVSVVLLFRLFLYVVNVIRGKGARKI